MRITVQKSYIFDRLGVDVGCAKLREWGFEALDFGFGSFLSAKDARENAPAGIDAPLDEILQSLAPAREALQKHGLGVAQTHAPFPFWVPQREDINKRMQEVMQKSIVMTNFLNAPYCVIHPGFSPSNHDRLTDAEEWALNKALYAPLIPTLREYKVVACLENMFVSGPEGMRYAAVCSNFRDAAEWIDRLNDMAGEELFGFCFDTGHCHLTGQNQRYALNCMGKRVKVLHMHDNDGHTDWHVAPYMGTLDWESFLQGLRDIGYDHDLSFETFHVLSRYPEALQEPAMRSIAQTGAYFRDCLSK